MIIDEAFEKKMSDQRAEKLINLIRDLGIQPILVNPSPFLMALLPLFFPLPTKILPCFVRGYFFFSGVAPVVAVGGATSFASPPNIASGLTTA